MNYTNLDIIWPSSSPGPLCHAQKNFFFTYNSIQSVTKVTSPPPPCVTSVMDDPLNSCMWIKMVAFRHLNLLMLLFLVKCFSIFFTGRKPFTWNLNPETYTLKAFPSFQRKPLKSKNMLIDALNQHYLNYLSYYILLGEIIWFFLTKNYHLWVFIFCLKWINTWKVYPIHKMFTSERVNWNDNFFGLSTTLLSKHV